MAVVTEYKIYGEDDKLFCKCLHDEDGNIRLVGKNTSVTLIELQKKATNPSFQRSRRWKERLR